MVVLAAESTVLFHCIPSSRSSILADIVGAGDGLGEIQQCKAIRPFSNPLSHVPIADIVKRKPCRQMPACSSTIARTAVPTFNPSEVIAAYSVRTGLCPARRSRPAEEHRLAALATTELTTGPVAGLCSQPSWFHHYPVHRVCTALWLLFRTMPSARAHSAAALICQIHLPIVERQNLDRGSMRAVRQHYYWPF